MAYADLERCAICHNGPGRWQDHRYNGRICSTCGSDGGLGPFEIHQPARSERETVRHDRQQDPREDQRHRAQAAKVAAAMKHHDEYICASTSKGHRSMIHDGVARWRAANPGVPLPPGPWAHKNDPPEESKRPRRQYRQPPGYATGPTEGSRREAWQGQSESVGYPRLTEQSTASSARDKASQRRQWPKFIGRRDSGQPASTRLFAEADQIRPATPPTHPNDLTDEYGAGIEVGGRYSIRELERRIDSNDGKAYVWEEYCEY